MTTTESGFYSSKRKGNQRKVTINSAQMLIGKAPARQKRIKLALTMGVSTQKHTGAPDWITAAYEFVARNHAPVTPPEEFKAFDIGFSVDNLFGENATQAPRCTMTRFRMEEMGDAETPDVVLKFTAYCPFSTTLWDWLGQFAGDEVYCSFTPAAPEDDEAGQDDEEEDEDEAEETAA